MPSSGQRPKPTLEELLRLKRAERPSPEFWNRFERELHQKQLAALVARRPWWQSLPAFLTRRAYLPIGATAILAFTLVSVKYYAPTQVVRTDESAPLAPARLAPKAEPHAVEVAAQAEVSSPLVNRAEPAAPAPATPPQAAPVPSTSTLAVTDAAQLHPWSAARPVDTPSARNIAANLASLEQTEPELVNSANGRLGAVPRSQLAASATGELASIASNASPRNRLLAYQYTDRRFTPSPAAPESVRERLARHLADPEITERFSRFGLQGDRVLVKF
jgi:hypothetical protein